MFIFSHESLNSLDSEGAKIVQAEIKNLITNFRLITHERDQLKVRNTYLVERNNFLESELMQIE